MGHTRRDAEANRMWDEVIQGDCLSVLPLIPAGKVDLAFADPPFNIGYGYDVYQDKRGKADYLQWTERWLGAVKRVLSPAGSLFVAIGDEYAAEMKLALEGQGFHLRNWIVWHYTFGVSCQKKFSRSHAHIFYCVVDPKQFTFNDRPVRVPSARQTTYADRRANPVGKLPDDTWVLRPQDTDEHFRPDGDTWAFPRVCGTFRERTTHPCQMPESVLERIIRVATNPGDLVLDPFAGSGTTLAVAKRLERKYVGVELSDSYATAIKDRLAAVRPDPAVPRSVPKMLSTGRTKAAGLKPR